ncbi:maleylpyruvate isomerase family mycothiol-dependent enzyme [Nonomuraea sp. NN258]|uniref:maleylpyruvate isomerase family mycothiol-dependent enzyme n=1 Tax=Nonomuraea antri TaxID=2730852 RepID=UPI001569852F|nr:maleylpyruvate isomerase family mycothiol-dependent enzyme [Nonomuraea antri]NRQ39313.1 maleylpyruvate isomerase family mycothiol-dependent enzyme [Nonomuraea antri]
MADLTWLDAGTAYFAGQLSGLDLATPSRLPGWTRGHVVAHVAANARALGRLASWARTGVETPMYASRAARDAEIEELAGLSPDALAELFERTAGELRAALGEMSERDWAARVRTAQGVDVPAAEIVWMRTREVWIHAVDLGTGTFADFPGELVDALLTDVAGQRARRGDGPGLVLSPTDREAEWPIPGAWPASAAQAAEAIGPPPAAGLPEVRGTAAELAAWITGRGPAPDPDAPELTPWL